MTERADVHDVGIMRINDNAADLARVLQSDVCPGFAGVGRFVDAVAGAESGANVRLTGANVENVGIGWRDFDGANRRDGLAIENRSPSDAGIDRLPDSAIDSAEVEGDAIAGAGDCGHASTAIRTDEPPLQRAETVG